MEKLKALFKKHFPILLLIGVLVLLTACGSSSSNKLDLQETQEQMDSQQGCYSCQLFALIYSVIAEMTSKLYPDLCSIALSVLALGLFGWILWHVLVLLTTLREPNLSQFWVSLFQTLFKAGFVAILIRSKEHLYELINSILEPIAMIFINLSQILLQGNLNPRMLSISEYEVSFQSAPGFPAEIGQSLVSLIYRVTVTLNVGQILGIKLMQGASVTDLTNAIVGAITTTVFFLMKLFFPFYLLDGLFRLAFVFALLPFFLVSWVFQKTEHFLKKAWATFLGAFAQIMVACIFVSISIATLEGFITISGYSGLLSGTVQDIDRFIETEADQLLYPFLSFLFLAVYIYSLSKRISSVSAHFTGAPASNLINNTLDRLKRAATALALIAIAAVAALSGFAPVAQVALDRAKKQAKKAASPKGGGN